MSRPNPSADRRLLKKLLRSMELELEKPYEEMDDEVVALCADCLMELKGKKDLSNEEIMRRLKEIGLYDVKPSVRKRHLRRILIAAVIAALLLILSLLAIGNDTLNNFFRHHDREMKVGDAYRVDEDIVVREGTFRRYDSIEVFHRAENLDLLFPTILPDGATINYVDVGEIEGKINVIYVFNPDLISLRINLNSDLPFDTTKATDRKEQILEFECFIMKESSYCQIEFKYKDHVYTISAPTYEDARFIVEHLEGESKG